MIDTQPSFVTATHHTLEVNRQFPGLVLSTARQFLPNLRLGALARDLAITSIPTLFLLTGDPIITTGVSAAWPQATIGAYLASRAIGNLPKLAENAVQTAEWIKANIKFPLQTVYEAARLFTPNIIWPDSGESRLSLRSLVDILPTLAVQLGVTEISPDSLISKSGLLVGTYLATRIAQRCYSAYKAGKEK